MMISEMTAPRNCGSCGANLPTDVRWCLQCYEPVRHLSPREPQIPTVHFIHSSQEPKATRWRAGPTTFGPVGRIVLTAVVIVGPTVLVPWPYLPLWAIVAVVILRDVWRKEPPINAGRKYFRYFRQ